MFQDGLAHSRGLRWCAYVAGVHWRRYRLSKGMRRLQDHVVDRKRRRQVCADGSASIVAFRRGSYSVLHSQERAMADRWHGVRVIHRAWAAWQRFMHLARLSAALWSVSESHGDRVVLRRRFDAWVQATAVSKLERSK